MIRPNETSITEIQANFTYDPGEGVVRWRGGRRGVVSGEKAGTIDKDGYLKVTLNKRRYVVHRIAFALAHGRWPIGDIDHVNRARTDNRVANLRETPRVGNTWNTGFRSNNKSGVKGVHKHSQNDAWIAQIRRHGKVHHLGSFRTVAEASAAYEKAAKEMSGEFYSGQVRKDAHREVCYVF